MEETLEKHANLAADSREIEEARALRSLVRAANRHFLELPSEEFVEFIRSSSYRRVLRAAIGLGHDGLAEGASLMESFLVEHESDSAASVSHLLGVDRTRLYRGVTPGYSPLYPAEAAWRGKDDRRAAAVFEELVVLYRENGMQLASSASERPDYIGVQLEFVVRMIDRRIAALEHGSFGEAQACDEAVMRFSQQHLDWFSSFVQDDLAKPETDFYRGHLLFVQSLCDILAQGI